MSKREYRDCDDGESSHSESFYSGSENKSAAVIENIARMVRIPHDKKQPPKYLHFRNVRVQRNRPLSAQISHSDTEGEKQMQKKRKLFYMTPFKWRLSAGAVSLEDISSIEKQKNKDRLREREQVSDKLSREGDELHNGPDFSNRENMNSIDERFNGFQNDNMWAKRVHSSISTSVNEIKLGRNMRAAPRRRCEFAEGVQLAHSKDKLESNSASQPLLTVENGRPADAVADYYFTTCPLETGCNKSHDPVLGLTSSTRTHVCPQHPTQDLIEMLNRRQQLQVQHSKQQKQHSEQLVLKQQAQQIVNEALLRDELDAKRKKENDTAGAKGLLSNAFPLADVTKTFFSGSSGSRRSEFNSDLANSDLERPSIELPVSDDSLLTTEIPRFREYSGDRNGNEPTQVVGQDNKEELMKFVSNELERLKTD